MPILKTIYSKLFTVEDKYNFHKSLGVGCLLSYLFRFAQVGPSDMNFGATTGTLLIIMMHTSLSVSSLIFRIPLQRIKSGYRIWPEYRIHSIVFACRSLVSMLLTWGELKLKLEPNYLLNAGIVLGTIAAADLGTWWVGPAGRSSTIQDLDAGPATRFFFSAMQFHASMGVMLGIRRFSTQFIYVWIIQFNAFLMTLRRKNMLPHEVGVTVYGFMLVFGFVVRAVPPDRATRHLPLPRAACARRAATPHAALLTLVTRHVAGGLVRGASRRLLPDGQHARQPRRRTAHRLRHAQISYVRPLAPFPPTPRAPKTRATRATSPRHRLTAVLVVFWCVAGGR